MASGGGGGMGSSTDCVVLLRARLMGDHQPHSKPTTIPAIARIETTLLYVLMTPNKTKSIAMNKNSKNPTIAPRMGCPPRFIRPLPLPCR